jgi:hypothetical protein
MRWKIEHGDWKRFRALPNSIEVHFHWSERGGEKGDYDERMSEVRDAALNALNSAQENGTSYIIFTHGASTSGLGKTTAPSVVRKLMRSSAATPYIDRCQCVQAMRPFLQPFVLDKSEGPRGELVYSSRDLGVPLAEHCVVERSSITTVESRF